MKKMVLKLAAIAIMVVSTSVFAGSPETKVYKAIYKEFEKVEQEIKVIGTAQGPDFSLTLEAAQEDASNQIAQILDKRVRLMKEKIAEQASTEGSDKYLNSFQTISRSFTESALNGLKYTGIMKQGISKNGKKEEKLIMVISVLDRQILNKYMEEALAADKDLKLKYDQLKLSDELNAKLDEESKFYADKKSKEFDAAE